MNLRTIEDIDLKNKTVLYRAPYDIGVKEVNGVLEVSDDLRIRATLPTLQYLLQKNCKVVILTYVKRPDGQVVESLRTAPHARRLSELLDAPVAKADDCIGPLVLEKIKKMQGGDILMLENVRFYKEEIADDDEFAKKLCEGKDIIVFDGFPQAHREHSSTTGIERHLPAVAGFYLKKEVDSLSNLLENPEKPFTFVTGGAKISDKIDSINNLLPLVDNILVGGALANVFLKAEGRIMGSSFIEDVFVDEKKREKKDWVLYAKEILEKYKEKIVLPSDMVISDGIVTRIVDINKEEVPDGWMTLDIGPKTQNIFSDFIKKSKTVLLAGPMGKFEDDNLKEGTRSVLSAMKDVRGRTVIAGGDTVDAAGEFGNLESYSHVSLAAGATLEFLAGKTLPALVPLMQ
ncbi:phosphoglycerate kinase [Candidatus Nomurabacteria bacterium RIFCSPHIGHO2_02_FULL_41_18]|uniref:Phosphoglycerate kinase n=1 Tax=Candidatus Nomurabacteria bacterium RIFCSPHIGHO2_02_FULL_41_18 TaxID=1801754 RepID=A0A1F6W4T6_9BACT|nr:MAG: phosphoglycerate kinase [Candidatus Nomurabacteria bacterium RIFCSPHIGHO2_01_FULL_41_71]OGI76948.1 MAG: phosphoglycerate kinase [Candidatus Nomurabacteria bacterium RIFCSPHIGHO2_02_FULL_41_18]OGI89458.1 MAG: phosphoglycerate kinase [Candidatus Nomurabacteria bacterium RIFCSPLOWO2_01_FULL_41_52b]